MSGEELLQLEYIKAHRNACGERMTEAQEQQLERRLTKLFRWFDSKSKMDQSKNRSVNTRLDGP